MGKHVVVDQKLCDKAQKLHNAGMSRKEIADFLDIGRSTVDRIVNASFDADIMTAARKYKEQKAAEKKETHVKTWDEKKTGGVDYDDRDQGQLKMDLEMSQEKKPANFQEAMDKFKEEKDLNEYDKRIMRFEAGQVEKICARLDKIYDLLGQALRRLDDGHTRNFKGPDQSEAAAEEEQSRH